ncbi:hypothetical protein BKA93DRAFT_501124 [Sparassis latifolia]
MTTYITTSQGEHLLNANRTTSLPRRIRRCEHIFLVTHYLALCKMDIVPYIGELNRALPKEREGTYKSKTSPKSRGGRNSPVENQGTNNIIYYLECPSYREITRLCPTPTPAQRHTTDLRVQIDNSMPRNSEGKRCFKIPPPLRSWTGDRHAR